MVSMSKDFSPFLQFLLAFLFLGSSNFSGAAESVDTRIGTIETQLGVPTVESVEKLFDEMDFQQAAQAYLWSLPTVGFEYVVREQRGYRSTAIRQSAV